MTESMDIAEAKLLTSLEKIQVEELNDSTKDLEQSARHVNQFIDAAESNWHVMVAKLSKEKYKAHSAIANSRVLIAKMERHIEFLEQKLENASKKVKKLDSSADKSLQTTTEKVQLIDKAQQTTPPRRRWRTSRRRRGSRRSKSVCTTETPVRRNLLSNDTCHKIQSPLSSASNNDPLNARTEVRKSKTPARRNLISIGTSSNTQNLVFSKASSLESNRTISESIIAEFERPFIKMLPDNNNSQISTFLNAPQKNVPLKAALPTSSVLANAVPPKAATSRQSESQPPRSGSLTAERPSIGASRAAPPRPKPQKVEPSKIVSRKRKIYPVTAFKKPHELLSCKSHIIYAPPSEILANLKPLNTGDPRTYYVKQALESKTGPIKLTIARKFNQATDESKNELRDDIRPPSEPEPQEQANDPTTHMQERDESIFKKTQERDGTMFNRNASNTVMSHLTSSTFNNITAKNYHTPLSDVVNRGIPKNILDSHSENRLASTPSQDVSNSFIKPDNQIRHLASIANMDQSENTYISTPSTSKSTGYRYRTSSLMAEDSDSSSNFSLELRFSSPDISEPDVSENGPSSVTLSDVNSRSTTILENLETTNGVLSQSENKFTSIPTENRNSSFFEKSKKIVPSPKSLNNLEIPSTPMSPDHPENDIARSYMKQLSNFNSLFMLDQNNKNFARCPPENKASPISEKSDQNKKLASRLPSETRTASLLPANSESFTIISQSVAVEFENPFVETLPDINSRFSTPILDLLLPPYISSDPLENRSPSPIPVQSEMASSMLNDHTSKSTVNQGENTNISTATSPNTNSYKSSIVDISIDSDTSILSLDFRYSMSPTFTELGDDDMELDYNTSENIILLPNSANCEGFRPAVLQGSEPDRSRPVSRENRCKSSLISVKSESIASSIHDMNRYIAAPASIENSPTTPISVKSDKLQNTLGPASENRTSSPNPTKSDKFASTVTKIEENRPHNSIRASIGNRSSTSMSIKPERQDIYEDRHTSLVTIEKRESPDHSENMPSRSIETEIITSITHGENRNIVLSPMSPDHPDNTVSKCFEIERFASRPAQSESRPTSPARKRREPISPMSPDHPDNTVSRSFKTEIMMPAKDENGYFLPVENRRPITPMSPNHPYENSQQSENKYSPSPMSLKYLEKGTPMSPDHPENDISRSFMKQIGHYTPTKSVSYTKEEINSPSPSIKQENKYLPSSSCKNPCVRNRQNFKSSHDKYRYLSRSPRSPQLDRSRDPYSKHPEYKNIYLPLPQREAESRHICVPSPPAYRRRSKPYRRDSDRYHGSARKGR